MRTVAGVIGAPIAHSRSPVILNAAFAAAGLDWDFHAFEVPEGEAAGALAGARALGLGGLSVTMPHKDAVALLVDELSDDAAALGAVNCVVPVGERRLRGESTDGPGFVDALVEAGCDPAGQACAVLGAGGAARAVVLALARAGASDVVVVNRTAAKAETAAALAGDVGRVGEANDVAGAQVVVNATSVGMGTDGGMPLDSALLRPGQVVADLVYVPLETPLLAAARARGAVPMDGLGMLVHQAARAFTLWTGDDAPLSAMQEAARSTTE